MPELPDIQVYVERLDALVRGEPLEGIRLRSPFLLRTVEPPLGAAEGRRVAGIERIGKRVVVGLEGGLFLVLHLMIAGRLRWRTRRAAVPGRYGLAAFDFPAGTLLLTEMGRKKRASLHVVQGRTELKRHDPGGLEVPGCTLDDFRARLRRGNHTLKRALADPRAFSGIGGAYSDEILWEAGLSPLRLTSKLHDGEIGRLWTAARETLQRFLERQRAEVGDGFPEKVTAFRDDMAVHGRYRQPCRRCGAPVQRIVYAENETNYCAPCQTGGKVLADRALSRLLKRDWPRTIEDWEALRPKK